MTISSILSSYSDYYYNLLHSSGSSGATSSVTSALLSKIASNIGEDGDDAWSYDEVSDYASGYFDLSGDVGGKAEADPHNSQT